VNALRILAARFVQKADRLPMAPPSPLRDVIRLKLERGDLPAGLPEARFAGSGLAGTCSGCDGPIGHMQIEVGFDYPDRTYRLHLECAAAWTALCHHALPDRALKNTDA
jgi:hypothetical protein